MKTVISAYEEAVSTAAESVKQLLTAKPGAIIALAAGGSTHALCEKLAAMYCEKELSLADLRLFAVTEFDGVSEERSCRAFIERELIEKTDIQKENCFFPSRENAGSFDEMIAAQGGLDLAILGLGVNAHIGYNEPATPFDSLTHVQKLTAATKRQLAPRFGGEENCPEYAVTMGIKTLVSARSIMLLAFGEHKADAVFKMLYGRNDSVIPAAFLQIPLNVTIYLDKEAAQKL